LRRTKKVDWFIQALNRGRIIEQHGKKWVILHSLANGYYLVTEEGSMLPADVKVIKEIKSEKDTK